jgi:hypothetical protein
MVMNRLSATLLLVCAALGACATPAERPARPAVVSPDPGTVFLFDDGRVERFVRSEAEGDIWATRSGRQYRRDPNPILPIRAWSVGNRQGESETFGMSRDFWPPAAGDRVQFRVLHTAFADGRERRTAQAWSCRTGATTSLSVHAGEFDVLPVECDVYSVASQRLLERRRWWWSPEVAHYIARSFQDMRTGEVSRIELCAAVPDYRAATVKLDALAKACRERG